MDIDCFLYQVFLALAVACVMGFHLTNTPGARTVVAGAGVVMALLAFIVAFACLLGH